MEQIMDKEFTEEREAWKIKNDIEADKALERLQVMEAEYKRLEMVANARIQEFQDKLKVEEEKLEREQSFIKARLQEYFMTVDTKETKTQKSYKLPSGVLKEKKEQQVIEKDDAKLLEFLKREYPELVKVKEVPDWVNFKKKLVIEGNSILNTETGEIIEVEGLRVGFKPAEFKIEI